MEHVPIKKVGQFRTERTERGTTEASFGHKTKQQMQFHPLEGHLTDEDEAFFRLASLDYDSARRRILSLQRQRARGLQVPERHFERARAQMRHAATALARMDFQRRDPYARVLDNASRGYEDRLRDQVAAQSAIRARRAQLEQQFKRARFRAHARREPPPDPRDFAF